MGTIDLSDVGLENPGDTAAAQVLAESDKLQRLDEAVSTPIQEISEQLEEFRRKTVLRNDWLEHLGIAPDALTKMAAIARAQSRASAEIVENARRLTLPSSLIRTAEGYQHDAEASLRQVEELQELERPAEENERTPEEIAVLLLEQTKTQTDLSQRQTEIYEQVLVSLNSQLEESRAQLEESRANQRSGTIKWWCATVIAGFSLLVAILSLLSSGS